MNPDLKRALGSVFVRDLRAVEPGRKGWAVGEGLRVYEEPRGYRLAFLKGTDERTRRQTRERLETAGVVFVVGDDFTT